MLFVFVPSWCVLRVCFCFLNYTSLSLIISAPTPSVVSSLVFFSVFFGLFVFFFFVYPVLPSIYYKPTNSSSDQSIHSSIQCSRSVGWVFVGQRDVSDMATQAFERLFATQLSDRWYGPSQHASEYLSQSKGATSSLNVETCWEMSGRISILGGASGVSLWSCRRWPPRRSQLPCHFHLRALQAWHSVESGSCRALVCSTWCSKVGPWRVKTRCRLRFECPRKLSHARQSTWPKT